MLDGERAKLAETDNWRKSQQELIDRERDALKKRSTKLQASKNTKEFLRRAAGSRTSASRSRIARAS